MMTGDYDDDDDGDDDNDGVDDDDDLLMIPYKYTVKCNYTKFIGIRT